MKQLFSFSLFLLPAMGFWACGGKTSENVPSADTVETVDPKVFEGEYIGNFGDGHIVIVLSYVQGKNVSGYNVHKGLKRNIKGTLTVSDDTYRFELAEPGDHPYDGKFDFTLNPADFTGKGTWTPNSTGKLLSKSFELQQRMRDTSESNFEGFWDGDEMLEIKSDGIAELTYSTAVPGSQDEEWEQHTLRGQWLVEGQTITVEWPQNPHNHGEKYILTLAHDDADGYQTLKDKGTKHEFYRY